MSKVRHDTNHAMYYSFYERVQIISKLLAKRGIRSDSIGPRLKYQPTTFRMNVKHKKPLDTSLKNLLLTFMPIVCINLKQKLSASLPFIPLSFVQLF